MEIKPSSALLTALASLQGGIGAKPAKAPEKPAAQTADAVPAPGRVDIRVGGEAAPRAAAPTVREAPGTSAPRPLQPGLGQYLDLTV